MSFIILNASSSNTVLCINTTEIIDSTESSIDEAKNEKGTFLIPLVILSHYRFGGRF